MKRNILKWKSITMAVLFAGAFASCNGNQTTDERPAPVDGVAEPVPTPPPGDVQEITQDVNDGTDAVLAEYMDVKNALVEDDYEEAKEEAKKLQEEINSLEAGVLNDQQKQELQNSVNQLAGAQDIQSQRQSFNILSRQLYSLANGDLTDKTLYWQHCPMAMDNQGANWLSFDEQIQNPYMGQEMPKCGSVEETINQN